MNKLCSRLLGQGVFLCVSLLISVFLAGCTTANGETEKRDSPQVHARAFIDFSGFTGTSPLVSHQPEQDSEETRGSFTLSNGITGDGLRISHLGDSGEAHPVHIEQHGGTTAARNNNYMYLFIDNADLRSAHTVTIKVTFFDDASGNFRIQYISTGGTNPRYTAVSIPKNGSNTFVTVLIQLDNCDFNGAPQNQGAQFRFDFGAIIQGVEMVTGPMPDPLQSNPPPFAPSTDLNNLIGKGITGYQLWFNTSNWQHWGTGSNQPPGPGNVTIDLWPAGWEDYLANGATLHETGFTMPEGTVSRVFNSHDAPIIRTHHQWMAEAGIDGSAVQRFFHRTSPMDTGDAPNHLMLVRDASEETGRIFLITYDMSDASSVDQDTVARRIQLDWIYNVERKGVVSSPNYAQAEGKPVVMIWGLSAVENTRYPSVDVSIELIRWFRNRGYYVIGGIPDNTFWEEGGNRHRRGREMYSLLDMISPWYIGRDVNGQILSGGNWLVRGLEFCRTNTRSWAANQPIAFMPTIWPGFSWVNMTRNPGTPNAVPRNTGQWIWHQVREYLNRDTHNEITNFYLALFDEYDESTAWIKTGTDYFDIPVDQYFLTLAADGVWLSSDYYMRLAKGVVQALKGSRGTIPALNDYGNPNSVIVEHSLGPVFWRNSFERRSGRLKYGDGGGSIPISVPVHHLPLDVGVPDGEVSGTPVNVTVNGTFLGNRPAIARNARVDRYTPPSTNLGMVYGTARSGESAFRLEGERTTGTSALYRYRIANTRVRIETGMRLRYWHQAENPLGANVIVDLLLDNGVYVSDSASAQNTGPAQGGWQQRTLNIPAALNGRYITGVIVGYRDSSAATGSFAALIDDIIIDK